LFETERPYPNTFLYLRTRTSIAYANDALGELWESVWPFDADWLMPFEEATWEDGLVIGLNTDEPPQGLADQMKSPLALFDAWTIHNLKGEWAEWTGNGPISAYFGLGASPVRTAQLFLTFNDPSDDPDEAAIDILRAVYGRDRSLPILHFRDGRILLINTDEPGRTIFRRLEGNKPRQSQFDRRQRQRKRWDCNFCGCDSSGDPFAADGRIIWERLPFDGLFFEDSEE
jgi:hypothetical protein